MTFKVFLTRRAEKYLDRLDASSRSRIVNRLRELSSDPFNGPNIRPMVGQPPGTFRVRIGNFRAVYEIDTAGRIIVVLVIGPRGEVYKTPRT